MNNKFQKNNHMKSNKDMRQDNKIKDLKHRIYQKTNSIDNINKNKKENISKNQENSSNKNNKENLNKNIKKDTREYT